MLMAEARARHEWNQTANLMALHANIHRDRKRHSRPYHPREFNPFGQRWNTRKKKTPSVAQLTRDIMRLAERKK